VGCNESGRLKNGRVFYLGTCVGGGISATAEHMGGARQCTCASGGAWVRSGYFHLAGSGRLSELEEVLEVGPVLWGWEGGPGELTTTRRLRLLTDESFQLKCHRFTGRTNRKV